MRESARTQKAQSKEKPGSARAPPGTKLSVLSSEIETIQKIGRKSVNDFTESDIRVTEQLAQRYWKEMGLKSPFFRAWFGDWRANDKTEIQMATERGAERGQQRNEDTGWMINVSGKVFNETKAHRAIRNTAARSYLPYINDIVKKAILLDSYTIENKKSENSLFMHSLYAVADIGSGPVLLKLFIEEMNVPTSSGTAKRAYQLQNIESQQLGAKGSEKLPSPVNRTADIETVADLFAVVKRKDNSFNPKSSGKVVNADGTPRVMYHGTTAEFTIFDRSKGKKKIHLNVLGEGNYFTQRRQGAERYGSRVVEAYIDIKNPYVFDNKTYNTTADQIAEDFGIDRTTFTSRDVTNILKGRGYDGVILYDADGNVVIANAFTSNQIKSATDNVGTFDKEKEDAAQEPSRGVTVSGSLADTTSAASGISISNPNKPVNTKLSAAEQDGQEQGEARYVTNARNDLLRDLQRKTGIPFVWGAKLPYGCGGYLRILGGQRRPPLQARWELEDAQQNNKRSGNL